MKKTVSKLKKELDKWFSLYIRLREANEYGMVQCFTCGVVRGYKDGMQNGHFQSRRHHSTRWNEQKLSSTMCLRVICFGQGEQHKFAKNLNTKYGSGTADKLEALAMVTMKITRFDYEENIRYYKEKVNNLIEEKGLF